jgi:ubiquitin carboxyl-terminal hydrolase 1
VFNRSPFPIASSLHSPSTESHILPSFVVTAVVCLALTFFHTWPTTSKRRIWQIFVFVTPSFLIYAMELAYRRRRQRRAGDVGFQRSDFGNLRAKSEAIQRVLGLGDALGLPGNKRQAHDLGPAGLGNWDNSCYQNSVIQSLASLPSFTKFLSHRTMRGDLDGAGGSPTHEELKRIIRQLNCPGNRGRRLWTPAVLKSMDSWQQQDAQEYFSKIIDEVDREVAKSLKQRSIGLELGHSVPFGQRNPLQGLLAQRVGCTRCGHTEGLSLLPFTCLTVNPGRQWECDIRDCLDEYTALESIDGVECAKCTVLRTKASLEKILSKMDVHGASALPTPARSESVPDLKNTVIERLKVISEVIAEDDFSDSGLYKKCAISPKSRVSSTKSKQATVARAPSDLVIHVNRSIFEATGFQRKNHASIRFPMELNLDRWCLGSDRALPDGERLETWNVCPTDSMLSKQDTEQSKYKTLYQLRSVITHYGGHDNGHYIAYRRRPLEAIDADPTEEDSKTSSEGWHCLNDDIVSSVSEDYVLSQGGVFMLFYEAIGQTWPSI